MGSNPTFSQEPVVIICPGSGYLEKNVSCGDGCKVVGTVASRLRGLIPVNYVHAKTCHSNSFRERHLKK